MNKIAASAATKKTRKTRKKKRKKRKTKRTKATRKENETAANHHHVKETILLHVAVMILLLVTLDAIHARLVVVTLDMTRQRDILDMNLLVIRGMIHHRDIQDIHLQDTLDMTLLLDIQGKNLLLGTLDMTRHHVIPSVMTHPQDTLFVMIHLLGTLRMTLLGTLRMTLLLLVIPMTRHPDTDHV